MSRIVCRESDYNHTAGNGQYYGLGQLNEFDVTTYTSFSWDSYVNGSSEHPATWYQLLAALRYCKAVCGDTTSAWSSEVNRNWW